MNKFKGRNRQSYFIFVIPALLIYTIFLIYPMISAFFYSLTDWNGYSSTIRFVGLRNFIKLFQMDAWKMSLKNTFKIVVFSVLLQNLIALFFALVLDGSLKTKNILRTLLFIPIVLSPLVTSYMWTYMYNYDMGVINNILGAIGLGALKTDWLGNTKVAIFAVAWVHVWKGFGLQMVIYLAAMQNIPPDVMEAAHIDGAGPIRRIVDMTLPLIASAFTINIIQTTIISLRTFETVFIMTQGGPAGTTNTIANTMYIEAFQSSRMGIATAIGLLLFLFTAVVALFQVKFLRSKEIET